MLTLVSQIANSIIQFAVAPPGCGGSFFGLVPWYNYLPADRFGKGTAKCDITQFKLLGANSDVVLILLAIVDDLLRVAGMVAVAFVIYGGFQYITSRGEPDRAANGRKTIINALIGLVLALVAVAVVSFIGRSLG